jgi:hypothetical protein
MKNIFNTNKGKYMKQFLSICIIVFNVNQITLPVELIGLGGSCMPAGAMRDLGLRKSAYPFDWMYAKFESMIKAFEDDFKNFLNPESLHIGNPDDRIVDYYGLEFVHDFPTIQSNAALEEGQVVDQKKIRADWRNFIDPIREKYNRRIERLKSILHGQEKVIFFRQDYQPLPKKDAINFRNLIQTLYPQLNFILILIEGTEATFEKWKFENCENFCIVEGTPNYFQTWHHLLNYLGVIPN